MFGYSGGDTIRVRTKKVARRKNARSRWPFLTSLDLSMVHNEIQLATLVKDRTGNSRAVADNDVRDWLLHELPPDGTMARWADDGGATLQGSAGASK